MRLNIEKLIKEKVSVDWKWKIRGISLYELDELQELNFSNPVLDDEQVKFITIRDVLDGLSCLPDKHIRGWEYKENDRHNVNYANALIAAYKLDWIEITSSSKYDIQNYINTIEDMRDYFHISDEDFKKYIIKNADRLGIESDMFYI